jgi:transposase-like protein
VIEEELEAAVRETVGRDYYERRPAGRRATALTTCTGRLATREGAVRYAVPQVRAVPPDLERLSLELFAHSCSTRDSEALFTDADGHSLHSRTVVSESTEALRAEDEGTSATSHRCICCLMDLPSACGPARRREHRV